MSVLKLSEIIHTFPDGTTALRGVDLSVGPGEVVAIIGPSGAGKSTLLRVINGLVIPSSGEVEVLGERPRGERAWRRVRRRIGMVFQSFNLIPHTSVLMNVLAGALGRIPTWRSLIVAFTREEREGAMAALERVGLGDKAHKRVEELSGGERQRVALARVLMQEPEMVLADEPVSNLDPVIARSVLDHLVRICREQGITTVMNLHAVDLARSYAGRIVGLRDGRVVFEGSPAELGQAELREIYGESYREVGVGQG